MNYAVEQHMPSLPSPNRVGQATAIEQSRAVAEVQAAIVVAQQCPRNIDTAVAEIQRSCSRMALAEKAFYSYPRGGETVSGPTIALARELARCWGNIQHGFAELSRDDEFGQSEMQASAWDLQTNSRSAQIFIVPHKRDTKRGVQKLVDLRDVYENNANNGARRLREAIFAVLPPWLVEDAIEQCNQTLRKGNGKPLEVRVADAIRLFSGLGITLPQLEQKIGRKSGQWSEANVVRLGVVYKSLQRGEVTLEEEFPQASVTVAEVKAQAPLAGSETLPNEPDANWPPAPQDGAQ